jgi:hypothetical protein
LFFTIKVTNYYLLLIGLDYTRKKKQVAYTDCCHSIPMEGAIIPKMRKERDEPSSLVVG